MPTSPTIDTLRANLREMFLTQASHIALCRDPETAATYLGWNEPPDHLELCRANPDRVDLSLFSITGTFERALHHYLDPSPETAPELHEVQDMQAALEGAPRVNAEGGTPAYLEPSSALRTVADAAKARFDLDEKLDLTVRQVALLADMTEGAVRNALSKSAGEPGQLAAYQQRGGPVMITNASAAQWLAGRRGYRRPAPPAPESSDGTRDALNAVRDREQFSAWIAQRIMDLGLTKKVLARQLGPWLKASWRFDLQEAVALADLIKVDRGIFVARAASIAAAEV